MKKHNFLKTLNRSVAFTLAEVLITLAIVGVVAALTMPTLINKCQDIVLENQRKVAISKLSQALGILYAKDQLGEIADADDMATAFSKIMNVVKVCKKGNISGCFTDEVSYATSTIDENLAQEMALSSLFTPPAYAEVTKLSSGYKINRAETSVQNSLKRADISLSLLTDGSSAGNADLAGVILNNGTSMLFMYNPDCDFSGSSINDTESSIRDIDMGSEMMSYTSSNILNSILGINPAYAAADDAEGLSISDKMRAQLETTTVMPQSKDQRACFGAIIDANGLKKKPNKFDKDIFYYQAGEKAEVMSSTGNNVIQQLAAQSMLDR